MPFPALRCPVIPDRLRSLEDISGSIRAVQGLMPDQQNEYIQRAESYIREERARRDRLFEVDKREWLMALEELGDRAAKTDLRRVAINLKDRSEHGDGSHYWYKFSNTNHLMGWLLKKGRCVYCNADLVRDGYIRDGRATTDHLVPYCLCRELDRDYLNAVPACGICNSLKWNMDPRK